MNRIYVDIYTKEEQLNFDKRGNKFLNFFIEKYKQIKSFFVKYKCAYTNDLNEISIKVDLDYINSICIRENKRYSFIEKRILKLIKNKFVPQENKKVYIVFSKKLNQMYNNKNYILKMFSTIKDLEFKNIEPENQNFIHDVESIDRYIKFSKLDKNNLKILVCLSSITEYNNEKMIEYISKFKQVDVFLTNKLSKKEINLIKEKLDIINNEYGTSIDILAPRKNISSYNVYLMYSKMKKEDFISKYIINKKAKYIDMNDIDGDFLNTSYKVYVKNEKDIKSNFNVLNLNLDNFSIMALGEAYKN